MHTAVDLWELVLKDLEEELSVIAVMTWFDEVIPVKAESAVLCLYCSNSFKRTNIERFYLGAIQKSLHSRIGGDVCVRFLSEEEFAVHKKACSGRNARRDADRFTFESFVVGESNRMAYGAAQAVAAGFDEYCNPLVLHGAPGLGKTHLLHAIASAVGKTDPAAKVICLKGDEFTNEMIDAIRADENAAFREKYRNAAVFLMDDVQFIAGKKQTQEEFFHTFDTLYRNGCSIVLTMDHRPGELGTLEKRLVSRFEGGLVIEIGEPEYATRLEIVRRKAVERGLELEGGEAEYIAACVTGSVRRIEGILNQLKAFGAEGERVQYLKQITESAERPKMAKGTPEDIIAAVARCYGVEPRLIKGRSRAKQIAAARQAAVYLMFRELGLTTTRIGAVLGRDHSTVCYALQRMEEKLASNSALAEKIDRIAEDFAI